MENIAIKMNGLNFSYAKQAVLFKDLNIFLKSGGICALLGKNGSGKTTLFKIITGLIFPEQGACQVQGYNPAKREADFLEEIYFLPEALHVPKLTGKEYVNFYAKFYKQFDYFNFDNYLKEFNLSQNKLLTHFSQGEKKKFLIAFGLATNARLLLLDEPTNGLDIPSKSQFRKLMASYVRDEKLILIATHQVHDIENLIDSLVVLEEGKIIFNQNLLDVAKKMAFLMTSKEPEPLASFYHEKRIGGYMAIAPNLQDEETQIDLEILFNAILANKTKIQSLFEGAC